MRQFMITQSNNLAAAENAVVAVAHLKLVSE
jgi:hypothetical protein